MKTILTSICMIFLSSLTQAQTVQIDPWAGPEEVRYFYEIDGSPHTFRVGGQDVRGYAVLKWERVKGSVQLINDKLFRYVKASGEKEVYLKAPGSRGFGSGQPLQLYVCEEGSCKGWVFVVPPFRAVRISPPEPRAIAPTPPKAPEPEPKPPTPPAREGSLPQVLETRRPPSGPVAYTIYNKGKR